MVPIEQRSPSDRLLPQWVPEREQPFRTSVVLVLRQKFEGGRSDALGALRHVVDDDRPVWVANVNDSPRVPCPERDLVGTGVRPRVRNRVTGPQPWRGHTRSIGPCRCCPIRSADPRHHLRMPRDPFSAFLEYRRRYIRDRWWLAGGALVTLGGVLIAAVSATGWIVLVLGLAVVVYGGTAGRNGAE